MLTRRELLVRASRAGAAAAFWPGACARLPQDEAVGGGVWVNDIHSQLNRTRVLRVERPSNAEMLADGGARRRRLGRKTLKRLDTSYSEEGD